jgi:signal transduction histidine kinase
MPRHALGAPADHALTFSELAQLVHDFKGPLSLVALETQVLQRQLDDGEHVEMVDAIARVLRNIDYIDRMVHDLIDSCAIDAGRFTLHKRPSEVCDLLEAVATRMAASRKRGRILLELHGRANLNIDALRIERVVANLLQNALTYSPEDTSVVLRLDVTRDFARVSVRDVGPGIAHDELEHVFDEYCRSASAAPHEGSGLGLFVSKQIVEAHGGTIGVLSKLGSGSEFYFELPLAP